MVIRKVIIFFSIFLICSHCHGSIFDGIGKILGIDVKKSQDTYDVALAKINNSLGMSSSTIKTFADNTLKANADIKSEISLLRGSVLKFNTDLKNEMKLIDNSRKTEQKAGRDINIINDPEILKPLVSIQTTVNAAFIAWIWFLLRENKRSRKKVEKWFERQEEEMKNLVNRGDDYKQKWLESLQKRIQELEQRLNGNK